MHALVLAVILAATPTLNNPSGEFTNLPWDSTQEQIQKMAPNVSKSPYPGILIDDKDTVFSQKATLYFTLVGNDGAPDGAGGLKMVLVMFDVDGLEKTAADKVADLVIKDLARTYGKGIILIRTPSKLIMLWEAPTGSVLMEIGVLKGHNFFDVMYVEKEFFRTHPFTPTPDPTPNPEQQPAPTPAPKKHDRSREA